MPTRKAREVKSAAPSPSPAPSAGRTRATRSKSSKAPSEVSLPETETEVETDVAESAEEGDSTEAEVEVEGQDVEAVADAQVEEASEAESKKLTLEERMAKMKELRMRMNQSTQQNRKDLIADHQKSKVTAKELARLEKQKKLAQTLRLKAEAEENGEDLERKKNWEYSIEDNERWEKKLEEQKVKQDTHFHNAEDDAHKRYNRNIRSTKVDLASYERQKEAALGLAPGTLVSAGGSSNAVAGSSKSGALTAAEDLYRGSDTLAYGDHKPSEDALDRVAEKINKDIGKYGKRKNKKDDEDDEVTYINERNKVFNKKVARYFDKYTKEIRANFERGTAL
ncbi:pre-mRNA-splicing factor SYF2 [Kwoniella mangroviensis CBS 10435]|uniref:Pre-mRNA-splicing factor SYF2 n=1 Tax=Kwoniella mangroviensis CBS 10435 TaxID=1331196 RepID=A0A1B9IV60_9TREE|nr:pre-mRNA-splicing factor SYF2 [Kwoniella mangroviensis CBS 10435]